MQQQQAQQQRKTTAHAPTPSPPPAPVLTSPLPPPPPDALRAPNAATELPRFLDILVTPKITFSLPRQPHWQVVEDIAQADLRVAFLSRFPVRFNADTLSFRFSGRSGTQVGVYR